MGIEDIASWDLDNSTWGGWGEFWSLGLFRVMANKGRLGVESFNSVKSLKSKDSKSKNRVLKNTNDKRSSAHVWNMSSSICLSLLMKNVLLVMLCLEILSRTQMIMEMIHVKFDELTAMASEYNNSESGINSTNFKDSSEDSVSVPSKTYMDNIFVPLYEEYYSMSPPEVSDISATNTHDNEDTSSSSSIIIEEDEAPQILSLSVEQVASEPNTLVLNDNADEFVQEDVKEHNKNVFYNPLQTLVFEEVESSSTYQDPSNMHEFHQTYRFTNK
uniref:Uncharacterized protein n=1 Tax=Tanacetum cinerariifolium TaxID=118510 RepID=A0A6L2MTJ6_TANCI|nr:hypothetical protein [Tanacetum cinerariifolium]